MTRQWRRLAVIVAVLVAVGISAAPAPRTAAWEPTKPIEFVIPAGTGGGADQMARLIAGIAEKHKLSPRPFIVVNKSGGAGAEGFLLRQGQEGRPPHHHHHAVQPFHDATAHRGAVQLEGPDADRAPGPRRVHPVGQRRDALQDREGVPRRGQGAARAATG